VTFTFAWAWYKFHKYDGKVTKQSKHEPPLKFGMTHVYLRYLLRTRTSRPKIVAHLLSVLHMLGAFQMLEYREFLIVKILL